MADDTLFAQIDDGLEQRAQAQAVPPSCRALALRVEHAPSALSAALK
ncbi:MAG: hypothetical protein HT580_15565 [Dechloromonas sp.]|nr:MAG: hypothetical protein HT580_15565 [Dechloromonas sp.]